MCPVQVSFSGTEHGPHAAKDRSARSRVLVPIGSARKVGIRWFSDSFETDGLPLALLVQVLEQLVSWQLMTGLEDPGLS